jgi:dual specificity tyrosine-phosphorylation-regulated kinase 2/3/4
MRPKDVLGKHASHLSMFEQAEILEYEMVYFLSKNPPRENKGDDNLGFDDKKGHYLCSIHDHVAYRYEVLEELGRGSFGQVHRAYDHKIKCHVALKIIKNKRTPNSQAKIEYGLLRYIKEADEDNCVNVVHVR